MGIPLGKLFKYISAYLFSKKYEKHYILKIKTENEYLATPLLFSIVLQVLKGTVKGKKRKKERM